MLCDKLMFTADDKPSDPTTPYICKNCSHPRNLEVSLQEKILEFIGVSLDEGTADNWKRTDEQNANLVELRELAKEMKDITTERKEKGYLTEDLKTRSAEIVRKIQAVHGRSKKMHEEGGSDG
jgi:hypothetical protein